MDRAELQSIQAPLKETYRRDPAAASLTLHADARLDDNDVTCTVQTGRALVEAGLHPASGGPGGLACSGDMLLQALVACAGVTMRSVATNRDIQVSGVVHAEGDLDFRGTMAVDRDSPVGFEKIRLSFELESQASSDELDALVAATERYCVVLQTLRSVPQISISRQ